MSEWPAERIASHRKQIEYELAGGIVPYVCHIDALRMLDEIERCHAESIELRRLIEQMKYYVRRYDSLTDEVPKLKERIVELEAELAQTKRALKLACKRLATSNTFTCPDLMGDNALEYCSPAGAPKEWCTGCIARHFMHQAKQNSNKGDQ